MFDMAALDVIDNAAPSESPRRSRVSFWEKAFGPDHYSVAMSLNLLAEIYMDQGKHIEAKALLKRSLAISKKAR